MTLRACIVAVLTAAVLTTTTASAESVRVGPATENVTSHSRVMHSRVLDQARPFKVHLPLGYARQPDVTYPLLIVLDGDAYSGVIAETAQLLRMRGEAPPVITLGISNIDRTRDFTPFAVDDLPTSGGAGPFLRFLKEELLPFLEQEYRANGYRIVFGHSFGGLLGTYALVCHPEAFDACLAASPAMYYDRGRTLRTIDRILAARPPAGPRYLYLSMADELTYAEALDHLQASFVEHGVDWLRWDEKRYPDEDHMSVVLKVVPDAIAGLFAGWRLPRGALADSWQAVRDHYRGLSAQMGYEVQVPEGTVNMLGYRALADGDVDEALRLFRWNTATYPGAANTWDSLAEGLLAAGDRDGAVENYRRSLRLDPGNSNAVEALERLGVGPEVPARGK